MKHISALLVALAFGITSVQAFTVDLQVTNVSCAGNDGSILATPVGGEAPYMYQWSTGAITPQIDNLSPGVYSVTVTDNLGATASNSFDVYQFELGVDPVELDALLDIGYQGGAIYTENGEPCIGACNGGFVVHLPRLVGGYTFSTNPNMSVAVYPAPYAHPLYMEYSFTGPACDGSNVDLVISNACGSSASIQVPMEARPLPVMNVLSISGSCNGANDGNVAVEVLTTGSGYENEWFAYVFDDQGNLFDPGTGYSDPPEFLIDENVQFVGESMHPGNWTVSLVPRTGPFCQYDTPIIVPDLGTDCATLSGVLHFETDQNCIQDGLEIGFPNQLVRVTPGPYYGISATDGSYNVAVPSGNFAVDQVNPDAVQFCPQNGAIPITISAGSNVVLDLADSVITPYNTRIALMNGTSRVGFPFKYSVTVTNDNAYVGENVVVDLNYDPLFTYVDASAGVTINNPGQIQWTIPSLAPFEVLDLFVTVMVPANPALLGTNYSPTAMVSSTTMETDLSDNTANTTHVIVSSYDPNDKEATSSTGSSIMYLTDMDDYIDYRIRFQNTGNDTAFNITVSDTISPLLNMESLQLLGASHPFTPSIVFGNVLQFTFSNIQLPDSNVNELESHGFVAFRMKPIDNVPFGSSIDNTADIYFDYNEAVRTNTASLEVGLAASIQTTLSPNLALSPVPVTDQLTLHYKGITTAITIRTMDGRLVQQYRGARTIDVSQLTPGVYLLQARTQGGEMLQARFVKQ